MWFQDKSWAIPTFRLTDRVYTTALIRTSLLLYENLLVTLNHKKFPLDSRLIFCYYVIDNGNDNNANTE